MEGNLVRTPYKESTILLTTKHAKALAVAKPFLNILGANVLEYVIDTDQLGTFSGEVERKGTALECAKQKCEWSLDLLKGKAEYVLASEGSFGPDPRCPFLSCDHEILYFIDQKRGFHFHLAEISNQTNYNMQILDSWDQLMEFAKNALFPSHALILRPNSSETRTPIFKGITSKEALKTAFDHAKACSKEGKVFVETDMRAHLNPSRMKVLSKLATKFATRLSSNCPKCQTPGWGPVRYEKGLKCRLCGMATELVKAEILGCHQCKYEKIPSTVDRFKKADPSYCQYCNP